MVTKVHALIKMIKVLFVCLGNICRSPMAEFVLKELVRQKNLQESFFIASAATSSEEVGNGMHRGTRQKLKEENSRLEQSLRELENTINRLENVLLENSHFLSSLIYRLNAIPFI